VGSDPRCKAEAEIVKDWRLDRQVSPDEDCPVQSVSWFHAVAFCNWLSHQEPADAVLPIDQGRRRGWQCVLDPQAHGYRLPSEAEWEYACRAKSERQYAFGDAEQLLGEYAWYDANSSDRRGRPVRNCPTAGDCSTCMATLGMVRGLLVRQL
jgi:formylglycine-generating enzyme required for sulfatase activity